MGEIGKGGRWRNRVGRGETEKRGETVMGSGETEMSRDTERERGKIQEKLPPDGEMGVGRTDRVKNDETKRWRVKDQKRDKKENLHLERRGVQV